MNGTSYRLFDPCLRYSDDRGLAGGLSVLAAFFLVIGLSYLRYMPKSKRPAVAWVVGTVFTLGGFATHYAAGVYAPEVFTNPLLAVIVVFNAAFAPCINGEKITQDLVMYTLLVAAGMAVATSTASVCAPNEPEDFVLAMCVIYGLMHGGLTLGAVFMRAQAFLAKQHKGPELALYRKRRPLNRVISALLSALFISLATLLSRLMVVLPAAGHAFHLVGIVGCSLYGFIVLNWALLEFEALTIVPLWVGFNAVLGIAQGMVIFQEATYMGPVQILVIGLAMAAIVVGCHGLAVELEPEPEREYDSVDSLDAEMQRMSVTQ